MTPSSASQLLLLPVPQHVDWLGGSVTLPDAPTISLRGPDAPDLLFAAQQLQAALSRHAARTATIRADGGAPAADFTIALQVAPLVRRAEGYRLHVEAGGVLVAGRDAAGVFYGVMTLIQLLRGHGAALPALRIDDWPDFAARGVMLDISRDKVPTMATLYALIDRLASWKINQFQLYTEHTFAYRNHRTVWEHASPMTPEQILALDAYCRQRHIELVPNQNSFGHMHRWFKHEPYAALAETDEPTRAPWGTMLPPFSLSPAVPESLDLLDDLYADLLPHFTSRQFNVGCDETFDLGVGRSAALVTAKGKGRVYLDFLLEIYRRVSAHGRTMQFWGDIINQYPELVPEIPPDAIALEWGYEADHDFPGKARLFAESGVPFYVCPGTSSWLTIAGRTDNARGNIQRAAENGLAFGALGLLNTDWGDAGHWQPLPVSDLGFAWGAALSWHAASHDRLDLPAALDAFAFEDDAGVMGRLAYDLGNVYQLPGVLPHNSSVLFQLWEADLEQMQRPPGAPDADEFRANLHATLDAIDEIMAPLGRAAMQRPDADLVAREFRLAADMLRLGARRGLLLLPGTEQDPADLRAQHDAIAGEFRAVWLARNRPGGLDDSAARLDAARPFYDAARS